MASLIYKTGRKCDTLSHFLSGFHVDDFEVFNVERGVRTERQTDVVSLFDVNDRVPIVRTQTLQVHRMQENPERKFPPDIGFDSAQAANYADEAALNFNTHRARVFHDPASLTIRTAHIERRRIAFLLALARQCAEAGVTPVVDFGFWNPDTRREAVETLSGCELDWRWLDVEETEWNRRIERRNAAILAGQADPSDYFVDAGLKEKVERLFIPPTEEELPGLTVIRT